MTDKRRPQPDTGHHSPLADSLHFSLKTKQKKKPHNQTENTETEVVWTVHDLIPWTLQAMVHRQSATFFKGDIEDWYLFPPLKMKTLLRSPHKADVTLREMF